MDSARGWKRVLAVPAGRRAKWAFVLFWVVVAGLTGPYARKLPKVETNDASAYLPASAQPTKANDALAGFPGGRAVPGVAVYLAAGRVTAADRSVAAAEEAAVARAVPDVKPGRLQLSPDGRAVAWSFEVDQPHPAKLTADTAAVRRTVVGRPGLRAYTGGAAGLLVDSAGAFKGINGILLVVTGSVVIVLLLLIDRSPILWLVPVLSVVGAIGVSEFVVYQLARHGGLVVSGQSGGILTVLVFGAGTDYALLITARYREELRRHADRHEAMRVALSRAAPAILASATTVILGLLCLLVATLNSDRGLGPVGRRHRHRLRPPRAGLGRRRPPGSPCWSAAWPACTWACSRSTLS
ncbi:MAG: MMPL family transporter [Acidimicrobiales bacterium]